jgi:hypothetical protein
MLHTLNKAWIECFFKQAQNNKNFLFVVKNDEESKQVSEMLCELYKKNLINFFNFGYICNTTEAKVLDDMIWFKDNYPMWDDILISSNIHNCMVKNFLHKHRKRKY